MGKSMRVLIVLLCLLPQLAFASPVTRQLFGHTVEIKPLEPDNEEALFIDGKQVLKNQIISLDETGQIGPTPFAIGNSSAGGNACDGSPFVIRFVVNEPVRIDGPLDSCWEVKHKIERDRIVFEVPASPTGDGQRWIWTPVGLTPVETLKFKVAAKGWDARRRGAIYHPVDLLGYRELAQALKKTVSEARYEDLKRLMSGPDKVHYDRNMFYGEACQAHACGGDTEIFIAIDFAARRVVVAMKDSDKAPVIIPAEADWPPAAKEELENWLDKWPK
jgi:hypothetical protein